MFFFWVLPGLQQKSPLRLWQATVGQEGQGQEGWETVVILCALGIMISYADPCSDQEDTEMSGGPKDHECLDDSRCPLRECLGSK